MLEKTVDMEENDAENDNGGLYSTTRLSNYQR